MQPLFVVCVCMCVYSIGIQMLICLFMFFVCSVIGKSEGILSGEVIRGSCYVAPDGLEFSGSSNPPASERAETQT